MQLSQSMTLWSEVAHLKNIWINFLSAFSDTLIDYQCQRSHDTGSVVDTAAVWV